MDFSVKSSLGTKLVLKRTTGASQRLRSTNLEPKLDFAEKSMQFQSAWLGFIKILAPRTSNYTLPKNVSGTHHLHMVRKALLLRNVWPQNFGNPENPSLRRCEAPVARFSTNFVPKLDFAEKPMQFRCAWLRFIKILAPRTSNYTLPKNVSGTHHLHMVRKALLLRNVWPQIFGKSWKSITFTKGNPTVTQSENQWTRFLEWAEKYWKSIEITIFAKKSLFFERVLTADAVRLQCFLDVSRWSWGPRIAIFGKIRANSQISGGPATRLGRDYCKRVRRKKNAALRVASIYGKYLLDTS